MHSPRQRRSPTRRDDDRERADLPPAARWPQLAVLALQRGAGNAAVTRLLQRDLMDDLVGGLAPQRARVRGMTLEDVEAEREEEKVERAGALATAEAQALRPAGPTGPEIAGIEATLANKLETGPRWDPTGPAARPGAFATAEAQTLQVAGPLDDEVADLEAAQAQKLEIGKSRNILNSLKNKRQREAAEQRRAAQAAASRRRRAEQEARKGDPAERRRRIEADEKTHPAVLEAERVRRQDAYERELPAMMMRHALREVQRRASALKASVLAAHQEIRSTLSPTVMARIEAAEKADPSEHAQHAAAIAQASRELSEHATSISRNRERKASDRLMELTHAGLAEALLYDAPALTSANADVQALVSSQQWLDIAPKLDALEAELAPFKEPLKLIADVARRAAYVRNHHTSAGTAAPAELVSVETRLNSRHATAATGVSALAADLHTTMTTAERPVAVGAFNAAASTGQWTDAKNVLDTLHQNGLIRPGVIQAPYRTSWDGDGFSVEVTVQNLQNIVIHSHCTKSGRPKDGENASHWKYKAGKFEPASSHPIPDSVRRDYIRAFSDLIYASARQRGFVK